ncbi:MAG: carboxymuconolactone decarboxylase family protein [Erysipelotrichaceae bacterium]|jgi:AhpD family alkylhydroperoxidase|nr:carboxymuconolactone decarboxylase family protein [Erysipelotrichaceae bacterium]MBQ9840796.1 carboxymuconolactone decarboxylase family protein [Erysipelotrichaceae bacterium]
MAKDVRQMLADFSAGSAKMYGERPEVAGAFSNFVKTTEGNGVLDAKFKELIGVAISVYCRCEYCIVYHVYNAFKHGATRQEIVDAAMTAMVYGGGPTMAYIAATLYPCVDEFEKDFQ